MRKKIRALPLILSVCGLLASCEPTTHSSLSSSSSYQESISDEITGITVNDFVDTRPVQPSLIGEAVRIYEPRSAEELASTMKLDNVPTVVVLTVDDSLKVVYGDGSKGDDFFTTYLTILYKAKSIPAIRIQSQTALDLYLRGIRDNVAISDCYIVSSKADVLKKAEADTYGKKHYFALDASSASLKSDEDRFLIEAVSTAVAADTVILGEENENLEEAVEWFNARFKSTWVKTDGNEARALCSGAYGVMTPNAEKLNSLYAKLNRPGRTRKQFLSAHRGLTTEGKYNQNSIPAILGADAVGATHVEIDLQITRDNVIVVCHDDSPAYFSDDCPSTSERFIDYDWDEMKDYRLTDNNVAEGNKIPTLEEALLAAKGTDLVFMLELKMDWCSDKALAKDPLQYVEEIVRKTGMEKQVVAITYYSPYALGAREHSPWMPINTIGNGMKYNLDYVGSEDPQGLSQYLRKYQWGCDYSLSGTLIANSYKLAARGFPINSYTYEDQSHFANSTNIATTDVAENSESVVAELNPESYIYLESANDIASLAAVEATTYGGAEKDVAASFVLLDGDPSKDKYVTGSFYYRDETLSHGLYSPAVTIGLSSLGAEENHEPAYEEKAPLEIPEDLREAVYGA